MTKQIPKFTKDTAQLYTCKWLLYNKVTKMYDHTVVNHSVREYITDSISIQVKRADEIQTKYVSALAFLAFISFKEFYRQNFFQYRHS